MLNRRTLRIKAMQAIFGYWQAEGANAHLALDQIAAEFEPDLMAEVPQDRRRLEGERQLGELAFTEWRAARRAGTPQAAFAADDTITEATVRAAVNNATRRYESGLQRDAKRLDHELLAAVERIYDHYLLTLLLPEALQRLIIDEREQLARPTRSGEPRPATLNTTRLLTNPAIEKLLANPQLRERAIQRDLKWEGDDLKMLRDFYLSTFKDDEELRAYLVKPGELTYDEHQEALRHLLKGLVFKDEGLEAWFAARDLNWEENRPVVRSLVNKTIKSLTADAPIDEPLLDLSPNWQEDQEFYEALYHRAIQDDAQYEQLIISTLQNWDVERVALTDRILLKLALAEMHLFRDIPVKVTINEYIEISKLYSTPKSKQFINGILDKLAQELTQSGAIRKSGKGLLDNK
ncbi:MAG: transcription antitermination factor NusB [Hymenobacteraceae bacterium]|nr:transcription antitermination factor NusB [Hymenobacteraceae bacterium]